MDKIKLILLLIVYVGFCLIDIIKPEITWKWKHGHDTNGGEPSDWYISSTRFKGVMGLICVVILIIVILTRS